MILCALLLAIGERAAIDYAPGMAFVRVEIEVCGPRPPAAARRAVRRSRALLPPPGPAAGPQPAGFSSASGPRGPLEIRRLRLGPNPSGVRRPRA